MSRLIKPLGMPGSNDRLTAPNVEDIVAKLNRLQDEARAKAAAIIRQAQIAAEKIKTENAKVMEARAHEEGYKKGVQAGMDAGRKEGLAELRKDVAPLQAQLHAILEALQGERDYVRQRAVRDLVEFAFRVAECVVRTAVEIDPEIVVRNVVAATELVLSRSKFEITVHPDELPQVEKYLPELKEKFTDLKDLTLVGDERVARGGCRVRGPEGGVDATIETQLQLLRANLQAGG